MGTLGVNSNGNPVGFTALGNVGIGTASPKTRLDVVGNTWISGNVGIGTTNPATKLQVSGQTRSDDFCLNAQPTKCLSNITSSIPPIPNVLYGWCVEIQSGAGYGCSSLNTKAPAVCNLSHCSCQSGYQLMETGNISQPDPGGHIFSCIKL